MLQLQNVGLVWSTSTSVKERDMCLYFGAYLNCCILCIVAIKSYEKDGFVFIYRRISML